MIDQDETAFVKRCLAFKYDVLRYWKDRGVPHARAMHDWKMRFVLRQIEECDISNVLEIGTCAGVSIMTIAYAIRTMGRKPKCWSIDIRNWEQLDALKAFPEFVGAVEFLVYPTKRTTSFLGTHKDLVIDYLNLDGDHTRLGVKYDYEHFSPLVKPGGLITFDDVSANDKFKGNENPNAYVRSLGGVTFIPNYPKPGEIGQSGPDFFAYRYKGEEGDGITQPAKNADIRGVERGGS